MKTDTPQLLSPEELCSATALIEETEYGPCHYLAKIKDADVNGFTFFKLRELSKDNLTKFYAIHWDGKMRGLASLKSLPWDEQIFKMKMATIPHLFSLGNYSEKKTIASGLISRLTEECRVSGIKHVSAKIDSRDMATIHALEENGFKLMDILTHILCDMNIFRVKPIEAPYVVREFHNEDIKGIMEVARLGFMDYIGRFHIDPEFNHQDSDKFYTIWARNSCLGYADNVFVAEKNSQIIGFITAKIHRDMEDYVKLRLGEIELVVISPESRGMGVYPNLADCCMNWLKRHADMTLAKTLIDNFQVQRVCQKLGFKLAQTQCTFHKSFV